MMVFPVVMQPREQGHDFIAGLGVQISGRLVGQHDGRRIHQRAGHGHALALPAGKFVGLVMHALAKIDGLERAFGARQALFRRRAVVDHGQLDIVQRCGARQQIERLKDESDFLVADGGQLIIVQIR